MARARWLAPWRESGKTTTISYADGQIASIKEEAGGVLIRPILEKTYAAQDGGTIETTTQRDAQDAVITSSQSHFNLAGNLVWQSAPGANGSTLTTTYVYDARGRRIGQTATGQPATRYVLNLLGEIEETCLDANGDGEFDDQAVNGIQDQVAKQESDYVEIDGLVCSRSRSWIRDGNNQDVLTTTTLRSVDGTWQKTVQVNQPIVESITPKTTDGSRVTTTTIQNGSGTRDIVTVMTIEADGTRLTTATEKDNSGSSIRVTERRQNLQDFIIQEKDGRGLTIDYDEHTADGSPTQITQPDGTITILTLDAVE